MNDKYLKNILILIISILLLTPPTVHAQDGWTMRKHKNGIKVYTKTTDDKNLNYYKLTTTFIGNLEDVVQMVIDFDNYSKWVKDCESSQILKKESDNIIIYYSKFKTPWPANDRDFVNKVQIARNGEEEVNITSSPADYSYPENEGVVRVTNFQDHWKITRLENDSISMELEGYYDPGGSIPQWIVNLFMVDGPYSSVLKIKEKAGTD